MMDLSAILGEASDLSHECLDFEPINVSVACTNDRNVAPKASKSSVHLKRTSKKSCDKPKRPLSAYNIFFQHEREKIITGDNEAKLDDVLFKIKHTPKPTKRRHRKSHGMIGFADLARSIADKWKGLLASEKAVYEAKAAIEKGKYREQLCEWDRSQEKVAPDDMFSWSDLVQVDDHDDCSPEPIAQLCEKSMAATLQQNQDSLSNLMMGRSNHMTLLNQMAQSDDVQGYLSMTQHTLDMARSSLSLPLFANLPIPQRPLATSNQHNQSEFRGDHFINNGAQAGDFSSQAYNTVNSMYQSDHSDFPGQFMFTQDFPY